MEIKLGFIKENIPYIFPPLLVVLAALITAFSMHITILEVDKEYHAEMSITEERYVEEIEKIPFDELKDSVFSNGDSIKVEVPIDYPYDKIVEISNRQHYNHITYQVENDNGKSVITTYLDK